MLTAHRLSLSLTLSLSHYLSLSLSNVFKYIYTFTHETHPRTHSIALPLPRTHIHTTVFVGGPTKTETHRGTAGAELQRLPAARRARAAVLSAQHTARGITCGVYSAREHFTV
jgi:hypothetical protein